MITKRKVAVCTDELYPVNEFVVKELKKRGYEVLEFGAAVSRKEEPWVQTTREAAEAVAQGKCDEGIFFCWTGTGSSIVANKVPGIRAALCTDVETTRGARIWNHANVLVLSNRLITIDSAKEILDAWFNTAYDPKYSAVVDELMKIEKK